MQTAGFINSLQIADSALPIGRFAHSYGFESFLKLNNDISESEILGFLESQVLYSLSTLDAVALLHSYKAAEEGDLELIIQIDHLITSKKLVESSRKVSTSCGRNQADLGVVLSDLPVLHRLHERIINNITSGNSAVVSGVLSFALGISEESAVVIEFQGVVSAILSSAVRLGHISTMRSQVLLSQCNSFMVEGLQLAKSLSLSDMKTFTPELDIFLLLHSRQEARSFLT